jgi:hypothetical protein
MSIQSVTNRPTRLRKPNGSAGEMRCPYCRAPLSRRAFEEIQARLKAEERARVERAKREAQKAAEAQVRALRASQEETLRQRLAAQREAFVKEAAELINAEKVKAFEETTKLTQQLAEMQRRLERRTPHELGEPAEVDLFEQLEAAFPGRVRRIAKGKSGPDVIVEVTHNNAIAGSIMIDSKNVVRWSNGYVTKLRSDQRTAGADFAILSTSTFPKGARQLHVQDGVIIADPARVTVVVHLLRRIILETYLLKLGSEAKNEKAEILYDFIISPACSDLLDRLVKLTGDLVSLDVKEADAHTTTWKKRGELIHSVREVHDQFVEAVLRITLGSEASP